MPLPIQHLSYSALMSFLRNPHEFRRTYIRKQYRDRQTPALVVGKAFHKCMETFYKGHTKEQALEMGFQLIHDVEETVDFGETGSIEKLLEDYRKTVDHYWKDGAPFIDPAHVKGAEEKMYGAVAGLPVALKAVADLVLVDPATKKLRIVDFKKVNSLSDPAEKPKREYYVQAAFLYWTSIASGQGVPDEIVFLEVKTSKNKEKDEPQCAFVSVAFKDFPEIRQLGAIHSLVKTMCALLENDDIAQYLFLPNISDMMNGEESWDEYVEAVPAA